MSAATFRIVDYNYAFQDNVEITASSENTSFPATNVGHEFRSKVWRSTGSYVITSSNNKINFKETGGGAELTAALTVGTYTTTTLAAEIKTKMDAATVNARTYTVSRSTTTGKWTIAGQTFLSLLFSTGTNAATSVRTVIGFGTNDFTAATTYTGPTAAWHTEEGVVIDLQSSEQIDTLAVLFDPRIGIKLSDAATIYLQGSATDAWTTPGYSQEIFIDNTWDIITLFLTTPQEYRFWRIKVVDPQNAFGYVELGTIVLGKYIDLGRCVDNGFELTWDDGSKLTTNDYGNSYVDEHPIVKEVSFSYNILTYTQSKSLEDIFRRNGNRTPVLVALDTSETLFDKDHIVVFGRMQDKFKQSHIITSYFQADLKIRESL